MRRFLFISLLTYALLATAHAENTSVVISTSQNGIALGDITLELEQDKAPETVANFLRYVDAGFYNGTIFHRVIDGFMIQGGGLTPDMAKKSTQAAVKNEADNGLKNLRGSIAMARTSDPHSATAQFFINVADNQFLDHTAKNLRGWGYAVFGKVTDGMDVVDKITQNKTKATPDGRKNVPVNTLLIESIKRLQ